MALVSSAGIQMMQALGGGSSGSTGKSQPPSLPDLFSQRVGICLSVTQFLEILAISIIAAEPLPGEIGGAQIVDMLIGRRRAPAGQVSRWWL